ncbi:uncharacterized protein ARMOST_20909 [Armillaria ostoyae]|uniref:Uncharacterized protein n=1 Tax=Armillaria ostoyae TaxID=47428 RepID=A0A284S8M0_ARMOS|nr:uncharacterized protein ARMOST_20909 [Armillaria ostoyae]
MTLCKRIADGPVATTVGYEFSRIRTPFGMRNNQVAEKGNGGSLNRTPNSLGIDALQKIVFGLCGGPKSPEYDY